MSASGTLDIDKWSHGEVSEAIFLNLTHFVLSLHSVSFWLKDNLTCTILVSILWACIQSNRPGR